jgi:hypothetical protein
MSHNYACGFSRSDYLSEAEFAAFLKERRLSSVIVIDENTNATNPRPALGNSKRKAVALNENPLTTNKNIKLSVEAKTGSDVAPTSIGLLSSVRSANKKIIEKLRAEGKFFGNDHYLFKAYFKAAKGVRESEKPIITVNDALAVKGVGSYITNKLLEWALITK